MSQTVHFILNGRAVTAQVAATELLVDTLREQFGLVGVKEGCRSGDCGTCTVLLNGAAVRSCLLLTCCVEGKDITTIEGLGDATHVHPIQQAFIDVGAVQCGFCIPGMVLAAKALLDQNPNPSETDIRIALSGNLCRCTGYQKIIQAIQLAAQRMFSNETPTDKNSQ